MATPRVLVLLAAFNGAEWIKQQIDSILAQRDVRVAIAVADDRSTDGTVPIVQALDHEYITVSTNRSSTGSAAQNFFSMIRDADAGGFDYVSFSDQDDLWKPTKLARACERLRSDQSSGYAANTAAFWQSGRERILRQSPNPTRSDFLFEGAGQGCTYVLTRDFYARARNFILSRRHLTDGLHYHDWTIYALARAWNLKWTFDAFPAIRYRQHAQNDTGAKLSVGGVTHRLTRIANGWYANQIALVSALAKEASPSDSVIDEWLRVAASEPSMGRRLRIARFCLSGGRRKLTDNLVLVGAAIAGWI